MNPNDVLAQQQALLNQAMNQTQQVYWLVAVLNVVGLVIGAWVVYLFYCRISEIAQELRKLRIAYEFSSARSNPPVSNHPAREDDSRFKPKI